MQCNVAINVIWTKLLQLFSLSNVAMFHTCVSISCYCVVKVKNLSGTHPTSFDARFLGGLSLHLNHLIAERMSAPYWQFRTLPIGIFLSNLVSGQLETSVMTSYCHFWNLSTFGDSRAVWVFWPKLGVFRKSKFSWWRSDGASMRLGGGGFR